jgi:ankyrin repeat protein
MHEKGYGETALHMAASSGKAAIVTTLISAGADVNVRDNYGDTPLIDAADHGRDDVVKLLIAAKADITARHNPPINRNALHSAAYTGNGRTVTALIDAGADPNDPAESGWTPLMIAMLYGKADVIEALLAGGANVNARSKSGWTALREAEFRRYDAAAKRLRDAGAIDFADGERK